MKYATEIQKLLCITDEQYEQEYLHRWIHWCLDRVQPAYLAHKEVDIPETERLYHASLQKIMANTAINNFYTGLHDELEYQALKVLSPQKPRVTLPKLKELYEVMMSDIFKSYPKPLIEAAKNLTISNDPHDHTAN